MKHLWLALLVACGRSTPPAQTPIENTGGGITMQPVQQQTHAGDRDGDGVGDNDDRCPDDPEDMDGFEDADGCPDPDNDKDTIPDAQDQCPFEPETFNGTNDDDGCPP